MLEAFWTMLLPLGYKRIEVSGLGWKEDSKTHAGPHSPPNWSHHAAIRGLVIRQRTVPCLDEWADFSGHP